MRLYLIALLSFGVSTLAYSQVPVIQNISTLNTFNNDTIVITGSGFSATAANLDVWFGSVKGTVISSTEFSIEVKVPAQATFNNIRVTNKSSFTSATSRQKFLPSLKTEPFDATKFAAPLSFIAQQELWDICLCDLNIDGKPDIASTKFARSPSPYLASQDLMVLQNNSIPGTLSFTKTTPALSLGYATDNIICGDLNADGKPELIASRGSDPRNSIIIFRNTSIGGSGSAITFAAPTGAGANPTILFLDVNHAATRMVLRDLNKDGKPEIVVTASTADFIYIFTNTSSGGTISFVTTPIKVDIDPTTTNLRTYEAEVQDFDADGLADIVVNRFQDNNFYILRNTSTSAISFAAPTELTTPGDRDFNRMQSADFNNDGKLDLVFTNSVIISQVTAVYLNTSSPGAISFTPDATAIKFTPSVGAWGIDVADIDGDKDPDMMIAAKDVNELNVFLHNGNFTSPDFTKINIPTTSPTVWNTRNIKVGDLDGDGKPDLVYTAFSDGTGQTSVEIRRNIHCHQPEIQNLEPLTICNGQSIVLKTIQANNVTYQWKKDGVVVGTNSPFLTITAGGTYRVTATNGTCGLFDEIVVTQNASATPLDPVIDSNSPICVGGTLTFNVTPATVTAGASYTWTRPDGTTLSGSAPAGITATLNDGGYYKVQAMLGPCKSDVATKRLDVANLASFAIASNPTTNLVCQGGSVQLTVSNIANHTYQWEKDGNDLGGSTTNTISANAQGSYTVRVKNIGLNCETETAAVSVGILAAPVATFNVDATACIGEQLTFTNTSTVDPAAAVTYNWNFGDASGSTQQSPTKKYNTAQNFTANLSIAYTGVTGCTSTLGKQIQVSNAVLPTIVSQSVSVCEEESTTLSVAGTFTSIQWDNAATGNSVSVTGPGTYSVQTLDANGCPGDDNITIGAKAIPTLTVKATPPTIPSGATTQLVAEIPEGGTKTFVWSPIETLSNASVADPIAAPLETTTYVVIGSLEGGCSATAEVQVTVSGFLGFLKAFSPNADGLADVWDIKAQDKPDCILSVFDTRGRRVFEAKGENWDGTYQGKPVPAGTYYYVFGCPSEKAITGSVLVMK